MGVVWIKCPRTGHAVSTGIEVDPVVFRQTPVFFSRTRCPHCEHEHEWFAADAWISESNVRPVRAKR